MLSLFAIFCIVHDACTPKMRSTLNVPVCASCQKYFLLVRMEWGL